MVSRNPTHYEILGVSKNALRDDLDEAYRKAVTSNVRYNNGDPEKFKVLREAYRLLSHPLERELYDQSLGRRNDAIHSLMVSLEDLYNGTTRNIPLFTGSVICSECKSIGGSRRHCSQQQCNGENVVVKEYLKEMEVHIEKGMPHHYLNF